MNRAKLLELLQRVRAGATSVEDAVRLLSELPFEDLGFAHVDHHRALRCGFPEVILATGKSPEQVVAIAQAILARGASFLATRVDETTARAVLSAVPDARHEPTARVVYREGAPTPTTGSVAIVTAGTSDIPVAEEARVTAHLMGSCVHTCYDVGVAGLHRILAHRQELVGANAIVVIAGMEGALASVVGGLVSVPVIAVPTSTGYGASFQGLTALLGMLNSCSANVSVVNIDNGFGAGYIAALINRLVTTKECQ
ncbi:MAG: nickel pincer cofactor biosynthesis protein LarB [Planctomycetota bacterium]